MGKILSHEFGNETVSFKDADGKVLESIEYAEVIADDGKAIESLRAAESAARKGHRGAMKFILYALANVNPAYAGRGLVTHDGKQYRAKMTTEEARNDMNGFKEAFRDVCDSSMFPAMVAYYKGDDIKARAELKILRSKGVFAVSASMARKFFYFTGKLPCAYLPDGTPDASRALAVSAMQKILSEIPEEESDSHTFAAKVRALVKEWDEKGGRTEDPADMSALLGYLDQWRDEIRAAETAALMATTGAMLPSTRAYEGAAVAVSKPVEEPAPF